ncbi:protogenin-like isoform X3 [Eriocheir sinensis]|uniref:protogenin-like isoform X3 n=1 Tax=Eriocheir sinensis TaxID=95602 RepID=UPI0021C9962F|nr:protogenin-like isoform X3 [Eriocheir sinensis]
MSTVGAKGKDIMIPCKPIRTEQGAANVTWIRNAMVMNDDRRYVLPNGTLLIKTVNFSDQGMYSCVLTVGNYSVTSPFVYLVLAFVSAWQLQPENKTVEEDRAVRLTCHIASLPEPTYMWLKDNETLPENETRYYRPTRNVLQITNVKPQDKGMYSCRAVNQLLSKENHSHGGYLSVVAREDPNYQHALLAVPSKVSAKVGERAVLECISDDEHPFFQWSRLDGMPIPENRTKRIGQGSLEFSSIMEYDRGVYNCTALDFNREHSKTMMIQLDVLIPPRIEFSMTISSRHVSMASKINNGQSIRITCATWGNPRPSISWFKNGVLHLESGRHHYTNKNTSREFAAEDLFIRMIMFSDMGLYQCVTRNEAGVASDGFILKIDKTNLPAPPINIRVVEVHPHNIRLIWEAPPKSSVSGYIVHFLLDKKNPEGQDLVNKTSLQKKELKSNTNYTIYIRSFLIKKNSETPFIGEPSEYISIKTKDEYPTEMPLVRLIPKSPTELYMNWTLEDYNSNNPIIEQKLQYKEKKKHFHLQKFLYVNVTSYTLKDLTPNKFYSVRVLIATNAGYPEHIIQVPWYHIRMPRGGSNMQLDTTLLTVHLSTYSQRPTEILVNWTLDASLQKDVSLYRVFCNNSVSSSQNELQTTNTSLILTNLDPEKCYAVQVQAIFQGNQNSTESFLKTLCTFPLSSFLVSQQSNTNKIKVKKLKAKILNSTSVLITWRHTSRRLLVNFYTIRIENIKSDWADIAAEDELGWKSGVNFEPGEKGVHSPKPTQHEEEASAMDSQDNQSEVPVRKDVRFHRVTSKRLIVTNLKPLHNYSITVTASTTTFTGPPSVTFVTPDEGVPTPPLNVTWVPASPKDAILTWNPPRLVNGHLLKYLVAFSHDEQEWRNQTIDPYLTTTQIQDLVSNTNYTLRIAGVTRKGVGASTTVFIYIRATLEGEPQITTESVVVISVVSLLAVVTCVVAVLLCFKILRLRNNSPSVFQGNGQCRMVYANGVKSSGRDHGTEPDDYKPMLASLPPATQNHHLDTKGGPGSHDDGIVANSLFDSSAIQMNQADGTSECMEPLRDGLSQHRMLDTLDDIADANDASRRLLQSMSTAQPVYSKNMKEFDHPRPMYNSTQVDHHSSTEDAGMDPAVSS